MPRACVVMASPPEQNNETQNTLMIPAHKTAFTTAEIEKLAHHLGWFKFYDNKDGTHETDLDVISETSSFYCKCGSRLWLLDLSEGPRSSEVDFVTCPSCAQVVKNRFHIAE